MIVIVSYLIVCDTVILHSLHFIFNKMTDSMLVNADNDKSSREEKEKNAVDSSVSLQIFWVGKNEKNYILEKTVSSVRKKVIKFFL